MRNLFFIVLFAFFGIEAYANVPYAPQVPSQMEIAGIKLKIGEAARQEIQKDVDALTRSPKYFNIKLERVKLYFPIIERIFAEEGVPDDFKYLAIQESALIADAVSTSNAVGYWQFKELSGKEVGLRIDRQVDERMHIVSATHGAAKYMKKNNFYFNNWIYALQAYQMGAGGAQKVVDKKYFGASRMPINKKTYWYVKKYIAHKVAFEAAYKKSQTNRSLVEFSRGANKNLRQIATEVGVNEEELKIYNKWLRKGRVPTDKDYMVMVPVKGMAKKELVSSEAPLTANVEFSNKYPTDKNFLFPIIKDMGSSKQYTQEVIKANGLPAIIAEEGNNYDWLALQGAVTKVKFLKFNEVKAATEPVAGQVYYFRKKKGKAKIHYHVVLKGETLWDVSQKYGIKLKALMKKNRMKEMEDLKEGRILWLRFIRPADQPIEYKPIPEPEPIPEESDSIQPGSEIESDSVQTEVEPVVMVEPEIDSVSHEDTATIQPEMQTIRPEVVEETVIHEVKAGETLYAISREYGVDVQDIIAWNDIIYDENYKLGIGEQLKIIVNLPAEVAEHEPAEPVNVEHVMHEVKPGETLFQIANKYEMEVEDILELNGKTNNALQVGEKLQVVPPDRLPESVATKEHIVQTGETLYQIARKYEMTIQELMDLNGKENFDIKVGEILQVKE